MIRVKCPNCGHTLDIPEQYAGKTGKCAHCKSIIEVPTLTPSPSFIPEPDEALESAVPLASTTKTPTPKQNFSAIAVILSVTALVFGLIGLLGSFVPLFGIFALNIAVPASLIGALAVITAYVRNTNKAFPVAVLTVCLLGTGISAYQYAFFQKSGGNLREANRDLHSILKGEDTGHVEQTRREEMPSEQVRSISADSGSRSNSTNDQSESLCDGEYMNGILTPRDSNRFPALVHEPRATAYRLAWFYQDVVELVLDEMLKRDEFIGKQSNGRLRGSDVALSTLPGFETKFQELKSLDMYGLEEQREQVTKMLEEISSPYLQELERYSRTPVRVVAGVVADEHYYDPASRTLSIRLDLSPEQWSLHVATLRLDFPLDKAKDFFALGAGSPGQRRMYGTVTWIVRPTGVLENNGVSPYEGRRSQVVPVAAPIVAFGGERGFNVTIDELSEKLWPGNEFRRGGWGEPSRPGSRAQPHDIPHSNDTRIVRGVATTAPKDMQ